MTRSMNKAERLREMERLYIQRPFSDAEMAKRLGVNRSTIYRCRLDLSLEHPIEEDDDGRHFIERSRYLGNIRVNLHEALALYLAARRASRQTRISQPHLITALEKLAAVLKQPMTEILVRSADQLLELDCCPEKVQILETVTKAWAEKRKLAIEYRSLGSDISRTHLVNPYLIEPSMWTDSTYLIALDERHNDVAAYKIERIEKAEMKLANFEIPKDFDSAQAMKYAWGIWRKEGEPVTVRLRFFPGEAVQRLAESKWHHTQEITPLPDGGCIWSAKVSEWHEMLWWVRSWGASVEVLEPEEMRKRVVEEVVAYTTIYNLPAGE